MENHEYRYTGWSSPSSIREQLRRSRELLEASKASLKEHKQILIILERQLNNETIWPRTQKRLLEKA